MIKKTSLKKQVLREHFLKIRQRISSQRKEEAAKNALLNLQESLKDFSLILSFASKQEELDLWPLNYLLADQDRLCLSTIEGNSLKIYKVTNISEQLIESEKFHFLQPAPNLCMEIQPDQLACVLVPGLAFDQRNHRIGYGKGFYDRFLKNLPALHTIGIGYQEQMFFPQLPNEEHDIHLSELCLF